MFGNSTFDYTRRGPSDQIKRNSFFLTKYGTQFDHPGSLRMIVKLNKHLFLSLLNCRTLAWKKMITQEKDQKWLLVIEKDDCPRKNSGSVEEKDDYPQRKFASGCRKRRKNTVFIYHMF